MFNLCLSRSAVQSLLCIAPRCPRGKLCSPFSVLLLAILEAVLSHTKLRSISSVGLSLRGENCACRMVQGTEYRYSILGTGYRVNITGFCLLQTICYFATNPNHISNCSFFYQTQPHQQLQSSNGANSITHAVVLSVYSLFLYPSNDHVTTSGTIYDQNMSSSNSFCINYSLSVI